MTKACMKLEKMTKKTETGIHQASVATGLSVLAPSNASCYAYMCVPSSAQQLPKLLMLLHPGQLQQAPQQPDSASSHSCQLQGHVEP